MNINKENVKKYAALSLCGIAIATSMVEIKCNQTIHSEKECPITRIELGLGFNEAAIKHQLLKAFNEPGNVSSTYGTLEKKYFAYGVYNDLKSEKKFQASMLEDGHSSCFVVDENDDYNYEDIIFSRKIIGTGLMSSKNFVLLREAKKDDIIVIGKNVDDRAYTSDTVIRYVKAIKYIGPAGKNMPNAVVLEDRDGNKKEVIGKNIKDEDLKDLFKTFYYDEKTGLYKIDEDLFVDFMRTRVVENKTYESLVVTYDEETHSQIAHVPEGCVQAANGMAMRITLSTPYEDFGLYEFEPSYLNDSLTVSDEIVRKLSK